MSHMHPPRAQERQEAYEYEERLLVWTRLAPPPIFKVTRTAADHPRWDHTIRIPRLPVPCILWRKSLYVTKAAQLQFGKNNVQAERPFRGLTLSVPFEGGQTPRQKKKKQRPPRDRNPLQLQKKRKRSSLCPVPPAAAATAPNVPSVSRTTPHRRYRTARRTVCARAVRVLEGVP